MKSEFKWRSTAKKKKPGKAKGSAPAKQSQDAAPTPERLARGRFHGNYDQHHDMIARLLSEGKITPSQEQAARNFEDIKRAFTAELGCSGFRSCLDNSAKGFDDGDGNPEVMRSYYDLRNRVGRIKWVILDSEVGRASDQNPRDISSLRTALDCVARA